MKNRPYPLYTLGTKYTIKQIAEDMAAENPGHIFFQFRKGGSVAQKTAAEFLDEINAAGTWLYHNGIKNSHVAIVANNSYAWVVLYFAIISSGNVVVPIDKDLLKADCEALLEHSETRFVFTDKSHIKRFTEPESENRLGLSFFDIANLDDIVSEGKAYLAAGEDEFINYKPDTSALASIVYTSGTTGTPKGVMLSQDNMLFDINPGCRNFTPGASLLSTLPFHHMFGLVVSLLMPLNWKCTVFINSGVKYLAPDFKLASPKSTMLVPLHIQSLHKIIMQKAKNEGKYEKLRRGMKLSLALYNHGIDVRRRLMKDVRAAFGSNLDFILVGGAALDPYYEREFRAFGIDIITAYGATECSPGIAVNRNYYYREGSCGLAVEDSEIRIAGDGEVMIRGGHVMSGYYHNEEETKKCLKDGWYMSGDLGYLDDDGFLFLTGRRKNLIILSDGNNVSPEVLESKIQLIPGVAEVLVYEENAEITAEIYPEPESGLELSYFEKEIEKMNESIPIAQRVTRVKTRDTEFIKNTSKKIIRTQIKKES